ncbi:MAG: hypothetical protein LBK76_04465 [Verrucomicrobiales bacterium]|jgi:hypothetical protein|nr:hypothetical protein [Verrucomicrobiales bacterium]
MSDNELKVKISADIEIQALTEAEESLQRQIVKAQAAGKAYDDLAERLTKVRTRLDELKPSADAAAGEVKQVGDALGETGAAASTASSFLAASGKAATGMSGLYGGLASLLRGNVTGAIRSVTLGVKGLTAAIATNPIGALVTILLNLVSIVTLAWQGIKKLRDVLGGVKPDADAAAAGLAKVAAEQEKLAQQKIDANLAQFAAATKAAQQLAAAYQAAAGAAQQLVNAQNELKSADLRLTLAELKQQEAQALQGVGNPEKIQNIKDDYAQRRAVAEQEYQRGVLEQHLKTAEAARDAAEQAYETWRKWGGTSPNKEVQAEGDKLRAELATAETKVETAKVELSTHEVTVSGAAAAKDNAQFQKNYQESEQKFAAQQTAQREEQRREIQNQITAMEMLGQDVTALRQQLNELSLTADATPAEREKVRLDNLKLDVAQQQRAAEQAAQAAAAALVAAVRDALQPAATARPEREMSDTGPVWQQRLAEWERGQNQPVASQFDLPAVPRRGDLGYEPAAAETARRQAAAVEQFAAAVAAMGDRDGATADDLAIAADALRQLEELKVTIPTALTALVEAIRNVAGDGALPAPGHGAAGNGLPPSPTTATPITAPSATPATSPASAAAGNRADTDSVRKLQQSAAELDQKGGQLVAAAEAVQDAVENLPAEDTATALTGIGDAIASNHKTVQDALTALARRIQSLETNA